MEHWIVTYLFVEDVVSTSDEKKAPPYMDRSGHDNFHDDLIM